MSDSTEAPTDYGMELCGQIDSEDELQEWLESAFEESGWTAIREASPHFSDYRADLIVQHDNYGWFGIETKYIGSSQGPIDMAKAHHQIVNQYRGKKYVGNRIDLWLVCPYVKYSTAEDMREPVPGEDSWRSSKKEQIQQMRQFFQHSGIGWIELNHYSLDLDFIESKRTGCIPVGKLGVTERVRKNKSKYQRIVDERAQNVDVSDIRSWAHSKVQNAPYGRPNAVRPVEEVGSQ